MEPFVRLDPALDAILPPDASLEKLAGGLAFTEGPIWMRDGYLLFSDIPNRAIMKWSPSDGLAVYRQPFGYTGPDPAPGPQPGPNGMTLDREGRLIVCDHGNRRLVRIESDGAISVLADRFEGQRLNSPNDVVSKSDGSIYFTDPPYGLALKEEDPRRELPFSGVYVWKSGGLRLLYKQFKRPNGIAFSPDEHHVYVSNSDSAHRIWMKFDVDDDGAIANGRVFFDVTGNPAPGNPDGMKLDREGNLYCTGPNGIWIFSPEAKHLGTIQPPELPANCHWGDADARTLYITARTGLYRIRLKIPGIRPAAAG